jgi:hypothetical protein
MTAFKFILVFHVIFCVIAFVAAPSAMMVKKCSLVFGSYRAVTVKTEQQKM